jgi:hypothetical protein
MKEEEEERFLKLTKLANLQLWKPCISLIGYHLPFKKTLLPAAEIVTISIFIGIFVPILIGTYLPM